MRDYKGFKVPTNLDEIIEYTIHNHPINPLGRLYWELEDKEIKLEYLLEDIENTNDEEKNEIFKFCLMTIEKVINIIKDIER